MGHYRPCLRADFRHYYGLSFDECLAAAPLEAADLCVQLPRGSRLLSALDPELSWTQEDYLLANIANSLLFLAWTQTKDGSKNRNRPKPIEPPRKRRTAHKPNTYTPGEYAQRLSLPRGEVH